MRGHGAPAGRRRAASLGTGTPEVLGSQQSQNTPHGPRSLGSAPLSPQRGLIRHPGAPAPLSSSSPGRSGHCVVVGATTRGHFPWRASLYPGSVGRGCQGGADRDGRGQHRRQLPVPCLGRRPCLDSGALWRQSLAPTGSGAPCGQFGQHPRPSLEPGPDPQGGSWVGRCSEIPSDGGGTALPSSPVWWGDILMDPKSTGRRRGADPRTHVRGDAPI